MTKKLVPIGNHKDKDMRLVRKKLLEIIEDVALPMILINQKSEESQMKRI